MGSTDQITPCMMRETIQGIQQSQPEKKNSYETVQCYFLDFI